MKTIVALIDFLAATPIVLNQAESLAKAYNAQVVIIHAIRPEVVTDEYSTPTAALIAARESAIAAGQEKLLAWQDSMAKGGVSVTAQQLTDATMESILAESRRLGADVIIVGSHHHSALYNLFVGSFTQDLLKHTTCPVLVVPADQPL